MIRTWQDALDFLYRRANWELAPPGAGPELKLGRVRALLARLGRPQDAWRSVHVGGTNGKGSTSILVATGLQAAGYRVGLFTSPHMHTMRERVRVNGAYISEGAVLAWLNRHERLLTSTDGLTTFEALVALAFSHFAACQVDIAVIEVGLGGQLDATNVLENQLASVITPVGLDHTEILGPTVDVIAADKAGIFRAGVPVVIAPQAPEAEAVLRQRAAELGTRLVAVGSDVTWRVLQDEVAGQRLEISVAGAVNPEANTAADQLLEIVVAGAVDRAAIGKAAATYSVDTHLLGQHQQANVATAVAVLDLVNRANQLSGVDERGFPRIHVSPDAISSGVKAARWPGRFEVFPLPAGGHIVFDGAHNPHGAAALVEALDHYFPAARRHLVLGIGGGKDAKGIVRELLPAVASVTTARSEHPKALGAGAVADLVRSNLVKGWPDSTRHVEAQSDVLPPIEVAPSVADAVRRAVSRAGAHEVVVCAGSIFLVADAREAWLSQAGLPLPPRDPPPTPANPV